MRLFPFALLALATPLHAQSATIFATPELQTFEYGIICYFDDDAPTVPLTPAQVAQVRADTGFFDLVDADGSTKIPDVAGITFGVMSNYPTGVAHDVTSTITHITRDGRMVADTVTLGFDDALEVDGWTIDTPGPANLGTYRFQTFRDGQTIYDLSFDVVTPEEFAGPLPPCVSLP